MKYQIVAEAYRDLEQASGREQRGEPVYPKNLYLDRAPYGHEDYRREVIDRQIELMHERDIWVRPGKDGPAEAPR